MDVRYDYFDSDAVFRCVIGSGISAVGPSCEHTGIAIEMQKILKNFIT